MKVNNICFCYKHQHEFVWDRAENKNRFILLFMKHKKDSSLEFDAGEDFAIFLNDDGVDVFPNKNETYVMSWIDLELDDDEIRKLTGLNFPFNTMIRIKKFQEFLDILQMMHREFYSDEIQSGRMIPAYLKLFFSKLLDIIAEKKTVKHPQYEKLLAIRAEIYANPTRRISVKDLASKTFLSVSYFQHLYKEYFKTTVVSDMILSRVDYGKNLLISSNYTIKEIAKILNYSDEVSFARQFRKVTGNSPKKYQGQFKKANTGKNR